ncbi:MAG: adenylyltransferase/cytidyltransferase family protein, partial [Bacteroidaceae bacterium]|nr:adenylyltransferase/cytidyltransferase family protein [Bacteroidaceae bacterium]
MAKKVFVSGCYDLLHSGHVEFFRQAAEYGDLYVGIGSDKTIEGYKHHKTIYSEQERLFMVKSIRYVKDAFINAGSGVMDFLPTLDIVKPDILVVNEDGGNDEKRRVCEERGIQYVVLQRVPQEGLTARSSTDLKKTESRIPTRLDLAGTWIDQPYVSQYAPGWAITISLEPTFEVRERCGLSTSTRNMIKKIWPYQLPNMDPEILAKLVFCFENDPERSDGIISGAQDSIGICIPGLCRHYYNNRFWPEKIETCQDEAVLSWLESHLVMIPMEPRRPGCSVVEGKDITEPKVKALAKAADDCWNAIMAKDLKAFAAAYQASFEAQVAMFPGMVHPSLKFKVDSLKSVQEVQSSRVQEYIDKWSKVPGVLAYKMPGAGGGGYLACVVEDAEAFCNDPSTPSAGSGTGSGQENEKPIR